MAAAVALCFVTFTEAKAQAVVDGNDSVVKPHFDVSKTSPDNENDLRNRPIDLRNPKNLDDQPEYDEKTGTYKLGTKIGDSYLNTPVLLSRDEYMRWSLRRSMQRYYQSKNSELFEKNGKEKFDFTDMKFDLGPAEKIFGPGGVQIKTQGSAELKLGANTTSVDNPTLPLRYRNTFGFDFDEKINVSVNGKVGDKMDMTLNYNTEATFDVDSKDLKLTYQGKEDEIIKLIEAGNISMPSNLSLVRGATSLFGFRTDMQFGKLKLQTVLSRKNSTTSSVKSNGGNQVTTFELSAADYEENRHFFLSHFFRDSYDRNMAQLPNITSGIKINRIEVWVTNKTGATTNTRNIIAFTDLGESEHISNPIWTGNGQSNPQNTSNSLYGTITTTYAAARDISLTTQTLDAIGNFVGGDDYEKLESARMLSSSEYTVNTGLGYISLKTTLQTDQVLAVAYEYTYRGQNFQVGEFSTDVKDNTQALMVKALKNTSNVPAMGNWNLMMKNVYSLRATNVQKDNFRLDVKYLSDTTGVYLSYLPENNLKDTPIIRLMNLDRLDNNNRTNPNGYFDFVDGYTIDASSGRVFFPSAEPFGSFLRSKIGNDAIADKYVFQELYDSTKTIAKQIAEKNKYMLTGQFKASKNSGEISLGAVDVPQGSVVVTAGGVTLTEGADYIVDYSEGTVTIINQSILDAGTPVNVSLESNTDYGLERKTLLGLNWQYDFSKNLQLAGTFMHLSEQPLTTKVAMGSEPLNNTIWGLSLSWKKESQWLTDMLDKFPLLSLTKPSNINFTAEVAQLIAGNNKGAQGNASYIDDFEQTKSNIDISTPTDWQISSTPSDFPESKYMNDIRYGYNRALLAWYKIDPLFTRRSSALTPSHIKSDLEQLSNHYVREVYNRELFPNKEQRFGESSTLSVLNVAYYPNERGPYNLDPSLDLNGYLSNPSQRWGGMMRKLNTSDFETANIEYVEFWMLDPFIYTRDNAGNYSGDLYINLGEVSEDILKDGKKSYESGMPTDNDPSRYVETVWGRVPSQNSVTYAFNTSSDARDRQDVGLDGLSSEDEASFSVYKTYLDQIRAKVSEAVYDSIIKDPAGDNYHYFRGSDFDRAKTPILERYKRINGTEGNSPDSKQSPESYSTAYKSTPDVEDINQDYTLNEYEKYFQYKVHLSPEGMVVGQNHIVDERRASVQLRNGKTETVSWYLFRVPVKEYDSKVGSISDFNSIRFMRMYLTNFENPIVLRFATLGLVRGEWRSYEQSLYTGSAPSVSGTMNVAAVNLEENNEKTPVNYVLPPGITRVVDPNQSQLLEQNEQALQMVVENLASGDARAVYKNQYLDLRKYKHIQMFVHANALLGDNTLEDNQASLFIRFGSDYKSNFYEYEIPLKLTPEGKYDRNSTASRRLVWPEENMLDINLSKFITLKRERNRRKSEGLATYSEAFSSYDNDRPYNKLTIVGNPSLGEVHTVMIGVRNNSRKLTNVEVWVNELRLQHYSNKGGWAAKGNLNVQLSDLGSFNLGGHVETAGFGGVEDRVADRRDDNLYEYNVSTNVELGKFLPEKVKLRAPLYYSYSKEKVSPQYDPFNTDMELDDAIDALVTKRERDSLRSIAETTVVNSNFSLSNVRFDISTKSHPMPYDPANFSFSYSHSHKETTGQTIVWEKDDSWRFSANYQYSPNFKPWSPFGNMKSKSPWLKLLKEEKINYAPQSISINSDITRSYYELQERDLNQQGPSASLPLVWASDFLWNRQFKLQWDLTSNIHASFNSATNAEILQPYTPVNKDLYPTEYEAWKDSVWHSIKNFGTPLAFQQNFDFSWKIPINKIPVFSWITSDVSYCSSYNWNRGTRLEDGSTLGNTINNSRDVNGNLKLNFETIYNSVPFLKKAMRRTTTTSSSSKKKDDDPKDRIFTQEVQLLADTSVVVAHNKRSRHLRVRAIRQDGSRYAIKYKVVNNNRIEILSRDTVKVKLTVIPGPAPESRTWYKVAQALARTAMMVRNVSVTYKNAYNMSLPGFIPNIGDVFGQRSDGGLQPGLDFAFGFTGEGYISKAMERGWLIVNDSITTPATTNKNESFQLRATVEPFRDFKIDLTASRTVNTARSIQYMFDGMPATQTGSFNITTISLSSAFASLGNADNNYENKTFRKFVNLLSTFRNRVEASYTGVQYPTNSTLAGKTFDPANGTVSPYSSDVMIPAFLAAYCGGGKNSSLDVFPSLLRMLPNWRVTYSGLGKLRFMRRTFKSFNINHSYQSIYAVGSYNTFSSFMKINGSRGFVNDVTTGNPVPSSMFDISTVSITENFSPFIGFDMTFNNNLTAKIEYNRARMLALSMASQQLAESRSNDYVVGMGYKVEDLKIFTSTRRPKRRNARRSSASGNKKKTDENTEDSSKNAASSDSQKAGTISNDLNLRLDFSIRNQSSIQRNVMTLLSQATSGNSAFKISFSADYTLSKLITLSAYYDRQTNKPLLSSSSYPTTTQDFGVSIKVSLTR